MLRMADLTAKDLVRPLSLESLEYFRDMELGPEWPPFATPLKGKFVRIGGSIFIGATIEFGEKRFGSYNKLLCRDIRDVAREFMGEDYEAARRAAIENGDLRLDFDAVVDAGHSRIMTADCVFDSVQFFAHSMEFMLPSTDARKETVSIADRALAGSGIEVIAIPVS